MKEATDSIANIDSAAVHTFYTPLYPDGLSDTLVCRGKGEKQLTDYPIYTETVGKIPEEYNAMPIRSTGTLVMLVAAFLIIAYCYNTGRKYFSTIVANTWSIRRTKNHLDDHTAKETITMIALILQAIIMEGMIAFCAFRGFGVTNVGGFAPTIFFCICTAGLYYVAQLLTYRMIGVVFARHLETDLWIQGFNASQSLMGLLLSPVAVVMLFAPAYNNAMLGIAVFLYFLARIAFLLKSFRVFYTRIFQCVYFILYLCAVEIVPYAILYRELFYKL